MALPDADTVGWYRHGAAPGDRAGSAVLAGHVDSRDRGLGALAALRFTRTGDRVRVTLADGTPLTYRVVDRMSYAKRALPADRLFGRGGPAALRLVTCGGSFMPEAGGYTENLVVTAVPTGSTS
ncbi:MAG: class F sortase [Actinomycetes bacterium]